MNYTELAESILSTSGRYDLQNADGTDNGLLKYVNRAQRMLDRKANIAQLTTRNFQSISTGDYCVKLEDVIVIKSVWLLPLVEGDTRYPLISMDWETLQQLYAKPISLQDTGKPTHFALGSFRSNPNPKLSLIKNMNIFAGFMDVIGDNSWDINGFFFSPVADADYGIQVEGKFYTERFGTYSLDGTNIEIDTTFWSANYPEILEYMTRYCFEIDNRNTEGRKDWLSVLDDMLMDLDFENVERSINDELVMGEEYL